MKKGNKDNKKDKKHFKFKGLKIFGLFVILFEAVILVLGFFKPNKWKRFIKHEKRELKELSDGQQDFKRFFSDSNELLQDIFIPNEANDHKPMVLRPKSLAAYVLIALLVKFTATGFLFTAYPSEAELSAIVSANMVSLMNQSRIEAGINPLSHNLTLASFAQLKGEDMVDRNYFAHDTPEGKRPWEWINRAEYDYVYAGENLAMDFITAEVVHDAFLKSPAHRKNILNPKYTEAGIAVLHGELDGRKTTLLVEFFGTQRKDRDTLVLNDQQEPASTEQELAEVPSEIAGVETPELPGVETPEPPDERSRTVSTEVDSPTPGPINEGVIVVSTTQKSSKTLIDAVVEYSNIFFIAFILFVGISLLLNIFIKIKVQHKSTILQSVVVIALLISLVLVKFHFIETVAPQMLIL